LDITLHGQRWATPIRKRYQPPAYAALIFVNCGRSIQSSGDKGDPRGAKIAEQKTLNEMTMEISRIVSAIAVGTDTPALRQAFLSLEKSRSQVQLPACLLCANSGHL
jgi:hypothetical protein